MSVGVPIKLLHEAQGHIVTLELKNGITYRGKLLEAEDSMNVQLRDITVTQRDGKVTKLEQVYVRGSQVRFFIVPDMLKNAPMFKWVQPGAAKARGIGMGRGKATVARAQQQQRGRGGPMRGGRGGRLTATLGSRASSRSLPTLDNDAAMVTPTTTELVEDSQSNIEIGTLATWSLSSSKPGFGVEQLRDDSTETYWQSDGPQPHLVNIQFPKKMTVTSVAIYLDYKHDESYTPTKISVRAGNHFQDLQEISSLDFEEPHGWTSVSLTPPSHDQTIRTHLLQFAVLGNHQNGKDTHIRLIKIYGPRPSLLLQADGLPPFSSREFHMLSTIR
ncbi:hypothetical protein SeLEV6574_g00128 [Synchytrium endobioticum]|uniref:Uncharacterized protein n=1 Tax=Synchytrium endobioticum TaxID=286115 RepID=A0A507DJE0_9FUNG|nr:hypothetical protein SeLEV6574_g00128 [Synchytrium endobioticum]